MLARKKWVCSSIAIFQVNNPKNIYQSTIQEPHIFYRETVSDLDVADIPHDRKQKFEKDAQIMIKMLPPQIEAVRKAEQNQKRVLGVTKTISKSSELSPSVDFEYNDEEGRFAVAKSNIQIGEKILSEEPHCVMLLEKWSKTHCQNCFKR